MGRLPTKIEPDCPCQSSLMHFTHSIAIAFQIADLWINSQLASAEVARDSSRIDSGQTESIL